MPSFKRQGWTEEDRKEIYDYANAQRKILREEFLQPINWFQMRIQVVIGYQKKVSLFCITKP